MRVVRVMPEPETCAPTACARVSGAATVIVALRAAPPGPNLPPRVVETTTAVSWFAPSSMVMAWPAAKPIELVTVTTVAPAPVAVVHGRGTGRANRRDDGGLDVRARVDRDRLAGDEARHAGHLDVASRRPAEAADSVVADCSRKSVQLLSASAPSGKRPRLVPAPPAAPGTTTMQPPLPWSPSSVASSGLAMVPLPLELLCCDP